MDTPLTGRFAPSPTGALHLGNLRTALLAWLFARSVGARFLVRMEDLDRMTSSRDHENAQLADLASMGLDWDGEVVRQSDRFERYEAALQRLSDTDRQAVVLRVEFGCDYDEIAAQLQKPSASAARMAVTRALARLAAEMRHAR